jgi:predicted anti-sigma-YlaC factor YlaD
VTCDRWREAISAAHDGEDTAVGTRRLAAHLATCAACRAFADAVAASDDRAAPRPVVVAAFTEPDLARRVARLAAVADRTAAWSVVRALLGVVAVEILVFSVPDLVLGDDSEARAHATRHLGAFTVAYAVGLLVVVVRPARARTMLPVAAVLAGALLITAVVDMTNGRVPLFEEAQHVPEVLSLALIWLVAVPGPRRRARHEHQRPTSASLAVVSEQPK